MVGAMNDAFFAKARRNMVDSQILPNRVTDERVIAAFEELPRELFLPTSRAGLAYADESILIDDDRYLMQPMVLARLLEILDLRSTDVALCIGSATGFAVAALANLVDTVVAVENNDDMRQKAERTLGELGIDNIAIVDGELQEGHPSQAPFDVILIDGAVNEVPSKLAVQLSDGGRLAAVEMPVGRTVGRGVIVTRYGQSINKREVFDASEPLLPGFEKEAEFAF
jgi:protein-L-isoaspartate(D-aspartate) O-methyltransferase